MLALLSPSKTLDFESSNPYKITSDALPKMLPETLELIKTLKKLSQNDISKLMDISEKLAKLNHERFQNFSKNFITQNSKPAIFAFKGDVYEGLDIETLSKKQIELAQQKIAILSGLYGLLQPLDLIQPYRLEMGTSLKVGKATNLYKFWGDKISNQINKLEKNTIINLASNEYFKAVAIKNISAKIVEVNFMEGKNGSFKTIGIFAKKARGLMARYIVQNNISKIADIKTFDIDGYKFNTKLSDDQKLIFTR